MSGWAKTVVRRLRGEYPEARCALTHGNPYELVVSTILSAQCTDEMVNKVTPALFAKYPTADDLAKARLPSVEKLVKSTGFFRNKARNITGMAKTLVSALKRDDFDFSQYKDVYVEKLTNLIQMKVEGKEIVAPPPEAATEVINLMDALRESVARAKGSAKVKPPRKMAPSRTKPAKGKKRTG